jgi:hypothetical protein
MQEIQLILAQAQTVLVQLAFQAAAVLGLGVAWLCVAMGVRSAHFKAWHKLFEALAHVALALGLLWLVVLATAWPPLLERVGNVLGPLLVASVAVVVLVILAVSLVRALVSRATTSAVGWLQSAATVSSAIGYTLALALVVLAQSWMREPAGAALIDGRFLLIDWHEILDHRAFAQALLATLLGALIVLAGVLPAVLPKTSRPDRGARLGLAAPWCRAVTLLGLVCSVGLLWLVSSVVGAHSLGAFYDAVLQAPNDSISAWLMRLLLVAWIVTAAGWMVGLAGGDGLSGSSALVSSVGRAPLVSAPLMWCLAWWNLQVQTSLVSGLPVTDLVSTEAPVVLALGLVLVLLVVLACLRFVVQAFTRGGLPS